MGRVGAHLPSFGDCTGAYSYLFDVGYPHAVIEALRTGKIVQPDPGGTYSLL